MRLFVHFLKVLIFCGFFPNRSQIVSYRTGILLGVDDWSSHRIPATATCGWGRLYESEDHAGGFIRSSRNGV